MQLARGDDWTKAGPKFDAAKLTRLDRHNAIDEKGLHGSVIGIDGPFGNMVLDIPDETFRMLGYRLGDNVPVTLNGKKL